MKSEHKRYLKNLEAVEARTGVTLPILRLLRRKQYNEERRRTTPTD